MHHDSAKETPLSIRKVVSGRVLLGLTSTSLVLASCSSTGSPVQSTLTNEKPKVVVQRAVSRTKDASSFELYLKVYATAGSLKGTSVTFSGVYGTSYGQKEARVLCTYHTLGSSIGATANIRVIGQNIFLEPVRSSIPLPKGKTWLHANSVSFLASYLSSFWPLFSSNGRFDPLAILSDLQYTQNVNSGGVTSFGGITQHIYTLATSTPKSTSAANASTSGSNATLDISQNGYISRLFLHSMVLGYKSNDSTTVSMELEMFSYAIPVDVSPPANSAVLSTK